MCQTEGSLSKVSIMIFLPRESLCLSLKKSTLIRYKCSRCQISQKKPQMPYHGHLPIFWRRSGDGNPALHWTTPRESSMFSRCLRRLSPINFSIACLFFPSKCSASRAIRTQAQYLADRKATGETASGFAVAVEHPSAKTHQDESAAVCKSEGQRRQRFRVLWCRRQRGERAAVTNLIAQ